MKILLLGEYSGFFNSLKEGLVSIGHEVVLAGRKDGFKGYPVDVSLEPVFFSKGFPFLVRKAIYKFTKADICVWEIYSVFKKKKHLLTGFDIVYLINEQPITKHYFTEKKILNFIFKNNKKVYLSACGDDAVYINYLLQHPELTQNILAPYLTHPSGLKETYKYSLHYTSQKSVKLNTFVRNHVAGIIPADHDYDMAYEGKEKVLPLIPYPVRLHLLPYQPAEITDKIIIFHGINMLNYYKKGNNHFEEALAMVTEKYADRVSIITAVSLPYSEYINKYNSCHIFLDQARAYDQGYNALEAMAKGKVVFTGASERWLTYYNLQENTVAFNATPNAVDMAEKLVWLIENPEKIMEISKNARAFIEREHHYRMIAEKYYNLWNA